MVLPTIASVAVTPFLLPLLQPFTFLFAYLSVCLSFLHFRLSDLVSFHLDRNLTPEALLHPPRSSSQLCTRFPRDSRSGKQGQKTRANWVVGGGDGGESVYEREAEERRNAVDKWIEGDDETNNIRLLCQITN